MTALVVTVAAGFFGAGAIDRLHPYSAADPDSESSRATDLAFDAIGIDPDAGLVVLVESRSDIRSPAGQAKVTRVANEIFTDRAIGLVSTYDAGANRAMVSGDGHATFIVVNFQVRSDRAQQRAAERLRAKLGDTEGVSFGGEAAGSVDVKEIVADDIARAELIALPLLFALSLWFFRGLVAAALPLIVGAIAFTVSLAGLRLINELEPISVFALNLVLGLSIATAVDYSLLIVSRYREEAAATGHGETALGATVASAGRTVLYSSIAVAATLATLLIFPQRFIASMGFGGALVAIVAGATALLVLPAALALLGERVDALSPRRIREAREHDVRTDERGYWYRVATMVTRRPVPIAVLCTILLVALGIPFARAHFSAVDVNVLPEEAESRRVREVLTDRFGPTPTLPLFVVAEAGETAAEPLAQRIGRMDGIADVDGPTALGGRRSLVLITPEPGPREAEAERLVERIRAIETPFETALGGRAADFADQRERIGDRVPLALALMALATFIVWFAMTGSLVLPLKGIALALLSMTAALGALVLVFQDGRLEGLLGFTSTGALELSQPLVLFALGFAIATDYGVFLVAQIKELYDGGEPNDRAVALGLERTGRILTAAALFVFAALGAFTTSGIVIVKALGLGIALAVLIDATIVRALLVPSLMAILGRWNWWAPAPLRRLHGKFTR